MSRGPGRWQRQLLERVSIGEAVVLTHKDHTAAEQNAIRRAANALESRGSLKIAAMRISGRTRLVAFPPDVESPVTRLVTGLDGKTYRSV
jgi:antitoxin (DNA-binding transcriptional repressor) of toxin-antitoxin stability system